MNKIKLFVLLAGQISAALAALDIGGRKQLFTDNKFVLDATGVTFRMNPPQKAGKVLVGTQPWENGIVSGGGTVIEDQGKFKMWYTALAAKSGPINDTSWRLCYAESVDGIAWTKPELGINEWNGSTRNNIVLENTHVENGGGIFIDPTASPDSRYKLLAMRSEGEPDLQRHNGWGLYIYTSPDGLRWVMHPERVFPFVPDTVNMALYDPSAQKFRAYVRILNPMRRVGVVETDDIMKPWPYAKGVRSRNAGKVSIPTTEIPDAFGVTDADPKGVDHYTSSVVKYPWADNVYFMFPSAYLHYPNPPKGKRRNDGPLDIQLAVSRDGLTFNHASRFPYIELGPRGSADSGSMYMYIGMLKQGNDIFQYYGGYDFTHAGDQGEEEKKSVGGVYLTRQRLDGFMSVEADHIGGTFVTPSVKFIGKRQIGRAHV
jgi:hypothetical protein